MSYGYGGWAPYVSVAERRRQAQREMEKLRKKGHPVAPVIIEGRTIATTFWGKAWCENLEKYHDYENRLARGRTYVRNGSVVDLQIAPLKVDARVSGSSMYEVSVSISAVSKTHWQSLCRDCTGGIDSLVELLQGRFSTGVMERLCRQREGLFPTPSEIKFTCSCPDYAVMCKHVAAVLYGVGARLDHKPELLFRMRSVDEKDLLAHVSASVPLSTKGPAAEKILDTDDLSALFGLEMAGGDATPAAGSGGVLPASKSRTLPKPSVRKSPESAAVKAKKTPVKKAPKLAVPAAKPVKAGKKVMGKAAPAGASKTAASKPVKAAKVGETGKAPERAKREAAPDRKVAVSRQKVRR